MNSDTPLTDEQLHAYVDGWLDEAEAESVAAILAHDADAARRVEAYRRINDGLRALHAGVLEEPVPARLRSVMSPARQTRWLQIAAAIGFLAVGGIAGWVAKGLGGGPAAPGYMQALASEAHSAHAAFVTEVRHPVEVAASDSDHLAAWVANRLGREVPLPSLEEFGLRLLGGRVIPASGGVAALFMYADPEGRRLTLYVRGRTGAHDDIDFTWSERGGVGTWAWAEEALACALSGTLPKQRMLEVSRRVLEIVYPEDHGRST